MKVRTTFGAFAMLLAATTASAKESSDAALRDALAIAKAGAGERLHAAQRFGDAVALAQSAGDLAAEDAAASALEKFYDDCTVDAVRNPDAEGKTGGPPSRAALLVAVMQKLDGSRCGAFVSAPALARNVLRLATQTGASECVAEAGKVLALHARKPTSGRAAAVAAKYADGFRADHAADAAAAFDAAAADAANCGWTDLAMHAATEAAAKWAGNGNADKAAASLAAVAPAFGDAPDPLLVAQWGTMLDRRLKDAPPAARKPFDDLKARMPKGSSASGAGGAGGKGGATDIGKTLPTMPRGKPFVSATRRSTEFELKFATKPAGKFAADFSESRHFEDEGGVFVGFSGKSVGLWGVDFAGGRGGPGGGSAPSPVRAYYLLAEGETWSVSKEGLVTITR